MSFRWRCRKLANNLTHFRSSVFFATYIMAYFSSFEAKSGLKSEKKNNNQVRNSYVMSLNMFKNEIWKERNISILNWAEMIFFRL